MDRDPRKQLQRDTIKAECARRSITIAQVGNAYQLSGPGVDLMVADLILLGVNDIEPYQPRKVGR